MAKSITESDSLYNHLEKMNTGELLSNINLEDQKVATRVAEALPQIEKLVDAITIRMLDGGRLFYVGAGTSGRLGVVDASECPPTYGVSPDVVIGLIAGGDAAIRKSVEFAEDDPFRGWEDISKYNPVPNDSIVGIAASGRTPYVIGAVKKAKEKGLLTGCITCNPETKLSDAVEFPIEVLVGPEFVTGSTRMKAGTAQKLVLNMISTSVMIKMGRIKDNKMVDMQLSNAKLTERGISMIVDKTGVSVEKAAVLLKEQKSVRSVLELFRK